MQDDGDIECVVCGEYAADHCGTVGNPLCYSCDMERHEQEIADAYAGDVGWRNVTR